MYIDPRLNRMQNSRSELRQFGGLNETYACSEAEYQDGVNFSSRDFPALSTRMLRRKMWEVEKLHGIYHLNGLLMVHVARMTKRVTKIMLTINSLQY